MMRNGKLWAATDLVGVGLGTRQVAPLLHHRAQVDRVERHAHLSDLVVLGEAVEVVHGENECLAAHFSEGDLNEAQK